MKIHPEMKEVIEQAMSEGMRHWRDKSPEQIMERVRKQMLRDQKALLPEQVKKGIGYKTEWSTCNCPSFMFTQWHMDGCNKNKVVSFFTPEPENRGSQVYYSNLMTPFMYNPIIDDMEDDNDDK